jgi:hypothetical protein
MSSQQDLLEMYQEQLEEAAARITQLEAELTEQCRVNGIGQQRELKLITQLTKAKSEAWNEIGAHAQQMGLSPEWVGLCREKAGHYLGDEK